ncbi:hypothetical protein HK100_001067 [Physocladia obscura]|uniref:N-acetyltransferase domain-containing protein n=1 Tax=Physocladia obscura TaxID=109957 RepID=A0AAD5SXI9_9FUNG|nr:hypothetical protein HK100_001067 [Physocladia obscura]
MMNQQSQHVRFRVETVSLESESARRLIVHFKDELLAANPKLENYSWTISAADFTLPRGTFIVVYAQIVFPDGTEHEFEAGCGAVRKIKIGEMDAKMLGFTLDDVRLTSKEQTSFVGELKRMFVAKKFRGNRIGSLIVNSLKKIAKEECGISLLLLETATYLPDAIKLYEKNGFQKIPLYGDAYVRADEAVCMKMSV